MSDQPTHHAPESRSGRYSGRVEPSGDPATENPARQPNSAPESVSAPPASGAYPDRGRAAAESGAVRLTAARLRRVHASLSTRDWNLLRMLDAHRFLLTGQLQQFYFHEHATNGAASRICRRVLARLHELRVIEPLERRIGGVRAGSGSYVWRVGLVGDQLLRLAAEDGVRARRKEPSTRWLAHCLAIADTHLALVAASRQGSIELLQVQTEPACWRSYLHFGGTRLILKPDLYTVIASPAFEESWFLEVDLGNESLPTLLGKCAQYEAYRRAGREQHSHGVFPRVVWILPDARRADRLALAIQRDQRLDDALYRVIAADELPQFIVRSAA